MQRVLIKISTFEKFSKDTKMRILKIASCFLMMAAGALSLKAQHNNVTTVDPTEFKALLKSDPDAILLDVRRPDEYQAGHLPGACNLNWLDAETFKAETQKFDTKKTIYVYCRGGRRSAEAANWLAAKGHKVVDLRGGWLAWGRCCGVGNNCTDAKSAVIDNIMARRSIRKYTDREVPRAILDTILNCGINAPNGRNQQAYEVKVVCDSASTTMLAEKVGGLYAAPVYIFIANRTDYDMSMIDVGLLSENICLSAWAYGLGTVNLGSPVRSLKENPYLLKKLGFSKDYDLCLALALGYPDEAPEAKPRNAGKVQFIKVAE